MLKAFEKLQVAKEIPTDVFSMGRQSVRFSLFEQPAVPARDAVAFL